MKRINATQFVVDSTRRRVHSHASPGRPMSTPIRLQLETVLRTRAARALGVGVLLLGALLSALAARRLGVDYASLHLMADGIANGTHIYDPAVQKELFATRYE